MGRSAFPENIVGPNGQTGDYVECEFCGTETFASDFAYTVPSAPTPWTLLNVSYNTALKIFYCELNPSTRAQVRSFKELCVKPFLSSTDFILRPRYNAASQIVGLDHAQTGMEVHNWQVLVHDLAPHLVAHEPWYQNGNGGDPYFRICYRGESLNFVVSRVFTNNSQGVEADGLQVHRWTRDELPTRMINGRNADRCPNYLVYTGRKWEGDFRYPLIAEIHDASEWQLSMLYQPVETPTEWVPVFAGFYQDPHDAQRAPESFSPRNDPIAITINAGHATYDVNHWHDLQTNALMDKSFNFLIHPRIRKFDHTTRLVEYINGSGHLGIVGWSVIVQWLLMNPGGSLELKARRYQRAGYGHVVQFTAMDDDGNILTRRWREILENEQTGLDITDCS